MSKIVYLIASHNNPSQLLRLVETIKAESPNSQVLIHHDYSSCYLDPAAFEQVSNVHIIEDYVSVKWGEFSMVQMELYCINWLMANSLEFDWLIFLSGQDYPIKSLAEIEEFLSKTEYDGFVEYYLAKPSQKSQTNPRAKFWRRCFYQYYKISSAPNLKVAHAIGRIINRRQPFVNLQTHKSGVYLGIRSFSTPFNSKFLAYTGSQWHTLSYRCIQYIHDFVDANPAFVKYYQKTLIPDEYFFQTILLNNPQINIFNDNKRYIAWDKSCPVVLSSHDFDRLIASDQHFARKFDSKVDTQILDRLDQYVLANNEQVTAGEPKLQK